MQEGILPAIESSHAIAHAQVVRQRGKGAEIVVACLSAGGQGRQMRLARLSGTVIRHRTCSGLRINGLVSRSDRRAINRHAQRRRLVEALHFFSHFAKIGASPSICCDLEEGPARFLGTRYPEAEAPPLRWHKLALIGRTGEIARSSKHLGALMFAAVCGFHIGGNKFRLIAAIQYNIQRIYVSQCLAPMFTYDRGP